MQANAPITVALVDDHTLFREGLVNLLREFDDIHVLFSASNGLDMQEKLLQHGIPEVVLMDINMPQMDGYAATYWLKQQHPTVDVLALSMYEDDLSIIKMLRHGAGGYILKESKTAELVRGIRTITGQGYYMNEVVSGRLLHSIRESGLPGSSFRNLTDRELQFLELCCSEFTYKEIADKMHVSPRTVDNYREELFDKLNLHSRTGLVLYAIKTGLVPLNSLKP
jgi:DNA-binding NarL/FixJ family response regulator